MLRLVALLLALPLALPAFPAAAAPVPTGCEAACTVDGHAFLGFQPAVLVARSGASITWTSADGLPHLNHEGALPDADGCLQNFYGDEEPSTVTFTLSGGLLLAEEAGVARACATAVAVEGGAQLSYVCVIHPVFMRGVLVVLA